MSILLELNGWTSFKSVCITVKNLNCQFTEAMDRYELYGPDANGLVWHTSILKGAGDNGSAAADQAEFETSYKVQAFNFAIGTRLYPANSPDVIADDDAISGTFSKSPDGTETVSDVWHLFDHDTYVSGAEYWTVGAKDGDWVQVDIVDKDGVLAPPGTVIAKYHVKRFLVASDRYVVSYQRGYWARPPVGLYLRIRAHVFNQVSDVQFWCNIYQHKPI